MPAWEACKLCNCRSSRLGFACNLLAKLTDLGALAYHTHMSFLTVVVSSWPASARVHSAGVLPTEFHALAQAALISPAARCFRNLCYVLLLVKSISVLVVWSFVTCGGRIAADLIAAVVLRFPQTYLVCLGILAMWSCWFCLASCLCILSFDEFFCFG